MGGPWSECIDLRSILSQGVSGVLHIFFCDKSRRWLTYIPNGGEIVRKRSFTKMPPKLRSYSGLGII